MTPTRLGIMPRRCSTHSLGRTIPATIQHCAERPVSLRDTVLPTLLWLTH
jgi:hypothetical protein